MGTSSLERYARKTQFLTGKIPQEVIEKRNQNLQLFSRNLENRKRLNGFSDELKGRFTKAEKLLWSALQFYRPQKIFFRQQQVVGSYIADFLAPKSNLIVELDGSFHRDRKVYDERRTERLEKLGYFVMRFANREVIDDPRRIAAIVAEMAGSKRCNSRPVKHPDGVVL